MVKQSQILAICCFFASLFLIPYNFDVFALSQNPDSIENTTENNVTQTQTGNTSKKSDNNSNNEEWVVPQRDTDSIFQGTLEYDKVPDNFKCDNTPKVSYEYVGKNQPVKYPDYDSLFLRIGGEHTSKDFQMITSLWNNNTDTPAKDLSYHILLKNEDGTDVAGGVYSPDAYSKYSTLGVALEANNNFNADGSLPPGVEKRLTTLFGSDYVTPLVIQPNGNYQLYIRVFDSEDDWISSDTCGIQAVIPIKANGDNNVSVGKIQFSNIKVSPIDTISDNLEMVKQIVQDAVEHKNDTSALDLQNKNNTSTELIQDLQYKDSVESKIESIYISPIKQFKSGIDSEKVICRDGLVLLVKPTNGFPACVKPDSVQKLVERGWISQFS